MKRNSPPERLRRRSSRRASQSVLASTITPADLIWALIGLVLTIGGTFLEAFITNPPWNWVGGLQAHPLGVSYQVGAVLLIGCLGGRQAAVISQLAYLLLGLTPWFEIFTYGSGLDYIKLPSFGYLLGFVPGAWVCGWLAFRVPVRLESLAFSCLCGLITIHAVGLGYLAIAYQTNWLTPPVPALGEAIANYSLYPLPGQLVIVCVVTVVAFVLRHLLFY